jgi:hypothetical protein
LTYSINDYEGTDSFFLLDLDERFDVILGMAWLIRHLTGQTILLFRLTLSCAGLLT